MACIYQDDWRGVADMLGPANKPAGAGAQFLICLDNTIHQALPLLEARSPLPWLHIAGVVESDVYPQHLAARGLAYLRPSTLERADINHIIMDELVPGYASPRQSPGSSTRALASSCPIRTLVDTSKRICRWNCTWIYPWAVMRACVGHAHLCHLV